MLKTLTDRQRSRISQTIRDHHLAFIAEVFGASAIPADDYKRLKAAGKIRDRKPVSTDMALAAHMLGSMVAGMPSSDAEKLSGDTFWKMVKHAPPELTAVERAAADITRDRMAEHVKGLGNKLDAATGHIVVDADQELRRKKQIRREAIRAVENRETAQQLAQRIKTVTKDLKRDWLQIAQTELHNATEEAKAAALIEKHGDDPLVYKRVRPDACPFCRLLYMNGKVPRVFRLSELQANGTNVGRKAKRATLVGPNATEYKAVLGAMHPWCQCTLHHMPAGMGFDSSGNLVYLGTKKSIVIESLDKALINHRCEESK